jgi:hypothetical protein
MHQQGGSEKLPRLALSIATYPFGWQLVPAESMHTARQNDRSLLLRNFQYRSGTGDVTKVP